MYVYVVRTLVIPLIANFEYIFLQCACVPSKSLQSCLTLCDSIDYSPPGSSVHGDSPGKNTSVGCHALLQGNLPNPGIEPTSPALQEDSLLSEPPGKPKNTGVGSLSLLQGIFLIQRWNPSPLHCKQILYCLSHQGIPVGLRYMVTN